MLPPLSNYARSIADDLDLDSLAYLPLLTTGPVDYKAIYEELTAVYNKYRGQFFFSPTRNMDCIPFFVPGGDWRKHENFTTESMKTWGVSAFTELAYEMPETMNFVVHNLMRWATPNYRILFCTTRPPGSPLHQDATYDTDPRIRFKPRIFVGGTPTIFRYVQKDGSEVCINTEGEFSLINGALPHYAKTVEDESKRRFSLAAGVWANFTDSCWDYLWTSYAVNMARVHRIPPEQQYDPKLLYYSYSKDPRA